MRLNIPIEIEMVQIAIVGLGPAGIFTLASLPESVLPNTLVIERGCIGGDIAIHYCEVHANISKAEITQTFRLIPKWANTTFPELDSYQDNDAPPLALVGKVLRRLAAPELKKTQFHTCELTSLSRTATQTWALTTTGGVFEAQHVVLCLGATPKTLNLPVPTIPLSIAFSSQLTHFVHPTEPIVVFGTSHSGVLVLKALKSLGCSHVYAVHRSPEPFRIAQTPQDDGLKQEAAAIATEIMNKAWGDMTPTLLNYSDFATLYRLIHRSQAVIYAIGFEPRSIVFPDQAPNLYQIGYCTKNLPSASIGFAKFIQQAQAFVAQFPAP
jgi:cation diffusion facilitator CzcD-associated flavoprotein CzcO